MYVGASELSAFRDQYYAEGSTLQMTGLSPSSGDFDG